MAVPFLFTLALSARAAYPFIVAGTRRGLSSRAIERTIRQAGLPISRGRTIVPLMRELRAVETFGDAVRFIPKKNTINVARLPEALTPIRRRFSFVVQILGRDGGGNLVDRLVTIATDQLGITPGEIEDAARQLVQVGGISDNLEEVTTTLQSGLQRAAPPAL